MVKKEVITPEVVKESPSSAHNIAPGKAKKKSFTNKNKAFLALALLVIVLVMVYFLFFSQPSYRFSFDKSGVKFLSNEYTPSEFFKGMKDQNKFIVSIDLVDGNTSAWVVNSLNLWLVALNADHKETISLVKTVDAQGNILSCLTNDANVLVSRELSVQECTDLISDKNSFLVEINLAKEDKVILSKNKLQLFASGTKTISSVNYLAIKQMYPNFDDILAIVNGRINSVK